MAEDARLEAFHAPTASDKTSRLSSDQRVTTSQGADILDASFPNAPAMSEHFEAAKSAKEPLDTKTPTPTQLASVAPSPQVAASGFDV